RRAEGTNESDGIGSRVAKIVFRLADARCVAPEHQKSGDTDDEEKGSESPLFHQCDRSVARFESVNRFVEIDRSLRAGERGEKRESVVRAQMLVLQNL